MSDRSSGGGNGTGSAPVVSGRKRGHQHHVRHSGTRRSNVPVDEVIAALRAEFLPTDAIDSVDTPADAAMQTISDDQTSRIVLTEIPANVQTQTQSDLNDSNNNVNRNLPNAQASSLGDNNNNNGDEDVSICSDLSESTASNNCHSKKVKTKRDGSKRSSKKRDSPSSEHRKRKPRTSADPPKGERPPLEGAADNDPNGGADIENDPEAAEWSKLRCTSERTEVVAEREYRRQNRRCADYPGLAFGRSIFSSDTMMKLNIIRNELHNIMKTQLKRVRLSSASDSQKCEIVLWVFLSLVFLEKCLMWP